MFSLSTQKVIALISIFTKPIIQAEQPGTSSKMKNISYTCMNTHTYSSCFESHVSMSCASNFFISEWPRVVLLWGAAAHEGGTTKLAKQGRMRWCGGVTHTFCGWNNAACYLPKVPESGDEVCSSSKKSLLGVSSHEPCQLFGVQSKGSFWIALHKLTRRNRKQLVPANMQN